jgi:hypothetical protein
MNKILPIILVVFFSGNVLAEKRFIPGPGRIDLNHECVVKKLDAKRCAVHKKRRLKELRKLDRMEKLLEKYNIR